MKVKIQATIKTLGAARRRWLKVAEVLGNIQFFVFLSIIYWLMIPWMSVGVRFLSDPLRLRRSTGSSFLTKSPAEIDRTSLNRQF